MSVDQTMSVLFNHYSPSMPGLGTPLAQTGITARSFSPATSSPYVGLGTLPARTGIVPCQADRYFQEEASTTVAMPDACVCIVLHYWEQCDKTPVVNSSTVYRAQYSLSVCPLTCPLGTYIEGTRGKRLGSAVTGSFSPLDLSFFFLEQLSMASSIQLEEHLYPPHMR